jgi:hypothetical protein
MKGDSSQKTSCWAKAHRLLSAVCGTTKVVPCYKARSRRSFSAASKAVPFQNIAPAGAFPQPLKSSPATRRIQIMPFPLFFCGSPKAFQVQSPSLSGYSSTAQKQTKHKVESCGKIENAHVRLVDSG